MYRNDAFEKIAYIMKNTDRKDKTWPNFAKMAKSMGCGTEFWSFFQGLFSLSHIKNSPERYNPWP